MKPLLLLFLCISLKGFCQDSINKQLQTRIYDIYVVDQESREQIRKFYNHELDTTEFNFSDLSAKVRYVDSLNAFEIKAILDTFGFPGYNEVGEDFSNSFWNVVQHQDDNLPLQNEALKKMKIECDRNNASKLYYAYLVDRVKVNSGEKQVYGTQMKLNADSTSYEPNVVIRPRKLDKRRAEVGLPPIADYIVIMNERYFGTLKKDE